MTSVGPPGARSAAGSSAEQPPQRPGRRRLDDLLGPEEAVDPQWRRRVVLLGSVSAAVVAVGMVPDLTSGPLTAAAGSAAPADQ